MKYARQNLRVYYYDLPPQFNIDLISKSHTHPPKIRDPHCDESFYSAEYTVSQFFKMSSIRTKNASEADFFYVPVLSTCYLLTNLPNDVNRVGKFFDGAMSLIIQNYPYWNASDGRDHVFMFAQGFGARLSGNWTKYRHSVFLVHNGDYSEAHFDTHKDIVIPPDLKHYLKPVGSTYANYLPKKKNFVMFGGQILNTSISDHRGNNYSGGVRQFIQRELSDMEDYRITGVRSKTYVQDIMDSVFCLAPHGWHKWSPRPAYAILLGCIPVVISEQQMLFLENVLDYSEISYWIKPDEVGDLDRKLRGIKAVELTRKELAIREIWRLFWYGKDGLAEEAIMYSLHRRIPPTKPKRFFL